MDLFCESVFWDSNLTWNTDNPDFTPCFQKTVLVWIPCGWLWVAALVELHLMLSSKEANIPRNKLNTSKLVLTLLLTLLQIMDIGHSIDTSENNKIVGPNCYATVVKLLTFILSAVLLCYNRKCGRRNSDVLFIFWLLLILAGLPQLRTEISYFRLHEVVAPKYNIASYIIYYVLIIIMFILNCFADKPPIDTPYLYDEKQSPEYEAGIPSNFTFSWFNSITITGYRRPLTEKDIWPLHLSLASKEVTGRFEKFWNRMKSKKHELFKRISSDNLELFSMSLNKTEKKKDTSILPSLCLAFGGQFLVAIILKLCTDTLIFASPKLLQLLMEYVEGNEPVWRGYLYAICMFVSVFIQNILMGQHSLYSCLVSTRIHNSLNSMVYKKALNLSNEAKSKSTMGEILNLMTADVRRISNSQFTYSLVAAPLQISLALYFLWGVLGPSILAGVAIIIVFMPINGLLASFQKKLRSKMMRYKDQRMKLMNEVLNGIKILKMYAWEPSFQDSILKIRTKELKILRKIAYFNSINTYIWNCTPFLVTLTSFTCFVLVNDEEVFDSKRAFVSLSLFNILRIPMSLLPKFISDLIQFKVSLKRLNKFMNADELDTNMIEHHHDEPDQIVVEEAYFRWTEQDTEPILKGLNIHISRGSLVAVVGAVGSGKSSFLSALLGEMDKLSGRVNIKGDISYVAQQAWIQNATVQNNILFGKPFDKVKYNQIIEACALKTDFYTLPGGDQTEIGEKGINLSGGQKQRVSLARAVYYDADNYFLDDPLSAVDAHVGKHIFDKIIGPKGLLKKKTRVWVTHNISYLAQVDLVLVLSEGSVSEAGTYQQLLEKKGAFAEFLLNHLSVSAGTYTSKDLENIKQDLQSKLGTEFESKLQWTRSLSSGAESVASGTENNELGDFEDEISQEKNYETEQKKTVDKFIEAEKAKTGNVKWAVYKHYLSNIGLWTSLGTVAIYVVMNSLEISTNFWLARWSNDNNTITNGTVDTRLRNTYLGVYGGLGFAQAVTSLFCDLLPFLACWKAAKVLHEILLKNILKAPLQFFETTPVGRMLSRFSIDVDTVDSLLCWQITGILNWSLQVLSIIFVISYSTPLFMTVILPIGLLYYIIQRIYIPSSRQIMRMRSIARSPIYSHFNESLSGASTIRAFSVKERFLQDFQAKVDLYQSMNYLTSAAERWLEIRLSFIGDLIMLFAALFAVIDRENISAGLAGLSISYTFKITHTLSSLVLMASEMETDIVAVERIKEYAETEQEAESIKEPGPGKSWPETGAVTFEGLTLSYRSGTEPALRDVTCVVAPREKLGIVGRTGAGKSTLTLGLFRIVEADAGRIFIDGVDIATIGLHQLRSRITIIPQDPVLFSGTLRKNLDPFETYTDDDIWRALEHAHLKPFVLGLEAGLRHEVAEGGENLSVGQRQLVCLARALLRKTPLLVLDEATAAVDLETDDLIQKTIRTEFAACTVLTIAHRLNTIMDSTKVMVLDKGQLIEYAPPEQLLQNKNSIFYSLAKDAGFIN